MTPKKIIVYGLLIAIIILGLLISMLNLESSRDFLIAKWAVCGILATVVVGASLLDLRYLLNITQYRISIRLAIRVLSIPLLVIVLTATIFALMGRDDLSEKIFLQEPFLPVVPVFLASIIVYLTYAYMKRSKV